MIQFGIYDVTQSCKSRVFNPMLEKLAHKPSVKD